jgi:hypothetical protein
MHPAPVFGHAFEYIACALKGRTAVQIEEGKVLPNGLFEEQYDTNGDSAADLTILSTISSTKIDKNAGTIEVEHTRIPVFWLLDTNYDGAPDVVYHDKAGEGKCSDIVVYKDLNAAPEPPKKES